MVDPNTPLYRYVSADRFIEMALSQKLALINPSCWNDSYERYWLELLKTQTGKVLLEDYVKRNGFNPEADAEKILKLCQFQYVRSFCLCFSSLKDEEVLWSSKADSNKCVMFETTAGKLMELFPDDVDCTIKPVQYDLESNTIDGFLSKFHFFQDGVVSHSDVDELLLHKRKCFEYEKEIRLIITPNPIPEKKVIKYPIPNLSRLINGVMVHPLATPEHVGLIEGICNSLKIPFDGKSQIYDFKLL